MPVVFTGIVEEIGEVVDVERPEQGGGARLRVRGPKVVADVAPGDSISVNGVCLTVVEPDAESFGVDVIAETLVRSNLGDLERGAPVDLERALPADGRLGGHIVQGHVDGIGTVASIERDPAQTTLRVTTDPGLMRYVIEKGSIAVDGVSLTVIAVSDSPDAGFAVGLIPTTLRETVLGTRAVGETVNLEVDVVAKYVERLTQAHRAGE